MEQDERERETAAEFVTHGEAVTASYCCAQSQLQPVRQLLCLLFTF